MNKTELMKKHLKDHGGEYVRKDGRWHWIKDSNPPQLVTMSFLLHYKPEIKEEVKVEVKVEEVKVDVKEESKKEVKKSKPKKKTETIQNETTTGTQNISEAL